MKHSPATVSYDHPYHGYVLVALVRTGRVLVHPRSIETPVVHRAGSLEDAIRWVDQTIAGDVA